MKNYRLLALIMAMTIAFTGCVSRGDESSSNEESSSSQISESSSSEESEIPADKNTSDVSKENSEESDSSEISESSEESGESENNDDDMPPEEEIVELPPPDFEEIAKLDGNAIPWGPSTQMDENNRPVACIGLQEKYGKYDAQFIAPIDGKLYLTFDEGYENGNSAAILDVLKEKEVSAVFFVTLEYVKANPELVQRMINEGHIVGNHSAGHPNYTKISTQDAMDATMKLHQYMIDNYDYHMTLFRYPEGAFSEQTAALLQDLGYKQVFWSFAYADWDPNKQMEPKAAFEKVSKATHDGGIFLLHAVSKTNTEILSDLIDYWRNQGLEVAHYDVDYTAD